MKIGRFGVVGAGIWGTMHMRAYSQRPDAELVAVCDSNEERARSASERFGVPRFYLSVEEMLNGEELDGVSVATPDAAHASAVLAALQAGAHVLVEKPLATTEAECRAMIEAADREGLTLMVDWHNRWNPPCYRAWRAARDGRLGDLRYIYYRLSDTIYVPTRMLPWAGASSVMWFLGSHAFDTTCWLMGESPTQVSCEKRSGVLSGMGVETPDLFVTILSFARGALAVVENLWILPDTAPALIDHRCEIVGTGGLVHLEPTHNGSYAEYSGLSLSGMPEAPLADMFVTPEVHGRQVGFAVESIYHFVDCVLTGNPPLATGRDGLLNTRIILAALKSADEGHPVAL